MIHLAPTILTSDLTDFNAKVELFRSFAKRIQIDIVDGDFAPVRTVALADISLPEGETLWDLHMMVSTPSAHLENIIRLKPHLCIFPAEVNEKLLPIFEKLQEQGIKAGVAFLQGTFPGNLKNLLNAADHALIFAGNLGRQGGTANLIQMEKASIIRNIHPDIEIGWDGGANLKNIRAIAHSGVNVVNIGSAITNAPDPAAAYKELTAESDRFGVRL